MTQTDERLARLETKMDMVASQLAGITAQLDGKLRSLELDVARLKLQIKWVAGVVGVLAVGSGSAVGLLKLIGGT